MTPRLSIPRRRTVPTAAALALACSLLAVLPGAATTLDSVEPTTQSVYGMLTLRGSDFGSYEPGVTHVVFSDPDGTVRIEAGLPYLWRDDRIQVRVPAGQGSNRIPLDELTVSVESTLGNSEALPFQVLTRGPGGELSFLQRTEIVNDEDVSGFLGDVDRNKARTKDADIGDVNGDGWPDLIDNNSNNVGNGTHSILRLNQGGSAGFVHQLWEPRDSNDTGDFAVTVPPGGFFTGNSIVYDADFVDLNNDELVDWVTADSGSNLRLRVAINNDGGVPGAFIEDTFAWLGSQSAPGSPDDVSHRDVNYDGTVDIMTSYRFSNAIDLFLNNAGLNFGASVRITGTGSVSMHDSFFIDANHDGHTDIIGVNENSGDCQLFLSDGNLPIPSFSFDQDFAVDAHSGIAGDFNADGVDDFALTKFDFAAVFINDPNNPGNFTRVNLPDPQEFVYDVEAGDVDLDGDIDLIGAAVILGSNEEDAARIWINDGTGTGWSTWSDARDILPGIGPYQRLSADLVDFDLDGDLDLYLTGGDGSGPFGFGMAANQFWENLLVGSRLAIDGTCPGTATIDVSAATPNGQVAIFGSTSVGQSLVGGPCPATELSLSSPSLLAILSTDANGDLSVSPDLPESACDFFLQVVDGGDCSVSNLVPVP